MASNISVFDVAAYILRERGEMTAMKLQKLCYYAKAWGLVWDEEELFPEGFEAWANGPVCMELYQAHKGQFKVSEMRRGDANRLTGESKSTVDAVLNAYGHLKGQQLSDLTHRESPWKDARGDCAPGEMSRADITNAAMIEFYQGLAESGD